MISVPAGWKVLQSLFREFTKIDDCVFFIGKCSSAFHLMNFRCRSALDWHLSKKYTEKIAFHKAAPNEQNFTSGSSRLELNSQTSVASKIEKYDSLLNS
jgi:hypothetical protein